MNPDLIAAAAPRRWHNRPKTIVFGGFMREPGYGVPQTASITGFWLTFSAGSRSSRPEELLTGGGVGARLSRRVGSGSRQIGVNSFGRIEQYEREPR